MKIVALAGGVGGAKLADGLAQVLPPEDLTVIVNTGDDFEYLGLHISPDLDTVCYTLAGLSNPRTGWGRADDTFHVLENIHNLGGPDWFRIGDKDIATHVERTRHLREGQNLDRITRDFCLSWGVKHSILPMSNDPIHTFVDTVEFGELPFQEYFVHRHCEPMVRGFRFEGIESACAAPGVLKAIEAAEALVICPSNPWVSIDPILRIKGIRTALAVKCLAAVSPIIGGQTVKGPAAKMYAELGFQPSALAIAKHYQDLLGGLIIDRIDASLEKTILQMGITPFSTDTIMKTAEDRRRLAQDVLNFIQTI